MTNKTEICEKIEKTYDIRNLADIVNPLRSIFDGKQGAIYNETVRLNGKIVDGDAELIYCADIFTPSPIADGRKLRSHKIDKVEFIVSRYMAELQKKFEPVIDHKVMLVYNKLPETVIFNKGYDFCGGEDGDDLEPTLPETYAIILSEPNSSNSHGDGAKGTKNNNGANTSGLSQKLVVKALLYPCNKGRLEYELEKLCEIGLELSPLKSQYGANMTKIHARKKDKKS